MKLAHFAEIDENNIVLRVLVVDNPHEGGGADFLKYDLNLGGTWVQTSYNRNIRKNFAGVGYYYDEVRDAFIPPTPYPSWLLNEITYQWEAPITRPSDGLMYTWDEATLNWTEVINGNP